MRDHIYNEMSNIYSTEAIFTTEWSSIFHERPYIYNGMVKYLSMRDHIYNEMSNIYSTETTLTTEWSSIFHERPYL